MYKKRKMKKEEKRKEGLARRGKKYMYRVGDGMDNDVLIDGGKGQQLRLQGMR